MSLHRHQGMHNNGLVGVLGFLKCRVVPGKAAALAQIVRSVVEQRSVSWKLTWKGILGRWRRSLSFFTSSLRWGRQMNRIGSTAERPLPVSWHFICKEIYFFGVFLCEPLRFGILERCKELVEAGHDVRQPDKENVTLLHWAAINNRLELVK